MNTQAKSDPRLTPAFQQLSNSAKRTYDLLLSHEYMKLDKICELATDRDPTLRRGQIEGALKILRDTGWVEWAKCSHGLKLKWRRREERLLVPMEPSARRQRHKSSESLDIPERPTEATMKQLIDSLATHLGHIDLATRQARADLAAMKARLKLFQ